MPPVGQAVYIDRTRQQWQVAIGAVERPAVDAGVKPQRKQVHPGERSLTASLA
jgi:hypothetical protein